MSHADGVEETANTPIDMWRRYIAAVGLRKSNILFLVFAMGSAAFLLYDGRVWGGVFIVGFGALYGARLNVLMAFLLGDWLRRQRNVAQ